MVLNMHWEQYGSEKSRYFLMPKDDVARKIYHVSWSKSFTNRLLHDGKVNIKDIIEVGNPCADLMSEKLYNSYISREKLLNNLKMHYHRPLVLRYLDPGCHRDPSRC